MKRCVLKEERKLESEPEERIDRRRLFHKDVAAKEKEHSPKDLLVDGWVSVRVSAEERRDLVDV